MLIYDLETLAARREKNYSALIQANN